LLHQKTKKKSAVTSSYFEQFELDISKAIFSAQLCPTALLAA